MDHVLHFAIVEEGGMKIEDVVNLKEVCSDCVKCHMYVNYSDHYDVDSR